MAEADRSNPAGASRGAQFSGIVVTSRPERLDVVAARIDALPGVEVYARHPHSGRLVVVQEAADRDAHQRGLRAIQALPDVVGADLVYHLADPDAVAVPEHPDRPGHAAFVAAPDAGGDVPHTEPEDEPS